MERFSTSSANSNAFAKSSENAICPWLLIKHAHLFSRTLTIFSDNLSKAFELAEEVENLSNQYIKALKIGKPKILSSKEMNKVLSKAKNYKRG